MGAKLLLPTVSCYNERRQYPDVDSACGYNNRQKE